MAVFHHIIWDFSKHFHSFLKGVCNLRKVKLDIKFFQTISELVSTKISVYRLLLSLNAYNILQSASQKKSWENLSTRVDSREPSVKTIFYVSKSANPRSLLRDA